MTESQPRLTIALVGPLPPPSGGMANQTQQLSRLLADTDIDVEVVQVNAPYRPVWITYWPGIRALFRLAPYLARLWRVVGHANIVHVMANSGWSWHLFVAPAVWIAHLRKVPVVLHYHGGEAESFFRQSFRWVKPTLLRCAVVIVPSKFLLEVFRNYGVPAEVVPNFIDLSRFYPATHDGADWPRQLHIVVTRNLEPIYDIDTALRAFAFIRRDWNQARMTIAGSGPDRGRLESLADELGLSGSVVFAGRLGIDDMANLYRHADLMINPSLADNAPISILEALASGVPVVSTAVGGIPYLVDDGRHALLVPPGDPIAMAGAVKRLLDEPKHARTMIDAGIAHVRQFDWSNVRERLLAIYDAVRSRPQRFRSA